MRGWRALVTLAAALGLAVPFPAAAQSESPNGVFLVAKRHLDDPNFRESVVLITQHGGGSPVGVIINRPMRVTLGQVFPGRDNLQGLPDTLFFGGPVSPRLLVFVFRADSQPHDALRVLDDVYMSFNQELLAELLGRPSPTANLRVYAGYSGWGTVQLQHEMARGDWHMVRADSETIFRADPARVWEDMTARASSRQARPAASRNPLAALAE
ncbi:MAG TPA: YqgE/AlgH family protein [Burkholderiales bacterium]